VSVCKGLMSTGVSFLVFHASTTYSTMPIAGNNRKIPCVRKVTVHLGTSRYAESVCE